MPKGMPIFQAFLLQNARWNFYTLLLYRKFYILLDIIVIHIICICVVNKSCIILYFHTSCHIKEKCVELFLFYYFILFYSLVRNLNMERPCFCMLQVTSVSSSEYCDLHECDLLELVVPYSYKKTYCVYVSFRFFCLCLQVL